MEVTSEMQEEVARWCGFKESIICHSSDDVTVDWITPTGEFFWQHEGLPDLTDLTNLFRWVLIPKDMDYTLRKRILEQDGHEAIVRRSDSSGLGVAIHELPGHTLFLAIHQLVKGEKDERKD